VTEFTIPVGIPPRTYITPEQLSKRIGTHPVTLCNWRREKRFGPPFIKLGNRVLYALDEVEAWLENHRHKPRATA